MKIPSSFEVAIESDQILEELTESILEKAGVDKDLTKILVAFSLSKTEELRSWDIGKDLYDFSKLLLNENDRLPLISLKEKSLEMHLKNKGKIKITSKVDVKTREDLSLAYSPGVAEPCKMIAKNKQDIYKYTAKGNMVAVVSDGTAVLGLGDIGPLESSNHSRKFRIM